jgi:predicted Fe-Mo cluster-binding NifX family protein
MIDSQGTPYILEVNAVIVTGYNGSAYPFFHSKGIDIAKIMTDTIEAIYEENCSE